jgi:HTH-type transcriptional regulator, sugar sensing transcriptional regulator
MKEELKSYGLSDKEVNIYLTALKSSSSTANRLSELSGIRRSTVYEILESLKKKGLVSSFMREKKYYFSAAAPETLIKLLKEKEKTIQTILPELKKLIDSIHERPGVELFEGTLGIKGAVEDMLNYKEIHGYGASVVADRVFGSFTANFAKKRVENKVMLKGVMEKNIPSHMLEKDVKKFTQIRTLDTLKDHNSVYFIYGHKIIIITLGQELVAMRITSPLLVESQEKIFNFLWRSAKKV